MAAYVDPDAGKSPEQLFAERLQRVTEALQLKQPDRIPIQLGMGYMLAEMYGVTRQELQDDKDLHQRLLEQAALRCGSDGFMSLPQFEKFYWPQLKALQVGLVEAGIQPFVFYEGVWDQRLTYLTELPKGKTAGLFQSSDIFKVKEVVGETLCIMGGMPNSLLAAGTVDEVRALTRKLCETVGKGGGYIMSNGVGELEGSRPELVKVWVEATKEFGVYR
jgi:hypothetical protein